MIKVVDNAAIAVNKLNIAIAALASKDITITAHTKGILGPISGAIVAAEGLKKAMAGLSSATVTLGADVNRTGRAFGMQIGWFRLTGQLIHWLVMGTLEIASTAIPALLAFGSALAGMYPTAVHIFDVMNSLVIASGGIRGALINSVGPLHAIGVGFGTVSRAMRPDVYLIFGSIIDALNGRMSTFGRTAESAGAVLARFASKLALELGPGGSLSFVTQMFSQGVQFMIQWGQVLGNLGHAFLNIVHSMLGVGKLLLDVLVGISKAFEILTANPVIGFLIGVAAAMSAAYRYGLLLVNIFRWLGGSILVSAIMSEVTALSYLSQGFLVAASYSRGLVGAIGAVAVAAIDITTAFAGAVIGADTFAGAAATAGAAMDTLLASIGPVGWAIIAIGGAFAAWWALSKATTTSTDELIKKVQSAPPTYLNLTRGIHQLSGALQAADSNMKTISNLTAPLMGTKIGAAAGAVRKFAQSDIAALTKALGQQAVTLVQLEIGYGQMGLRTGQVGAGMQAMAIQTAIADSKVQQLNGAIDQYISLLTGGTSAVAGFANSMQNILSVQATTGIANLGRSTATTTLSVRQFANALKSLSGTGAGAWQNFDQVLTGSMPQLLDWFRTAGVLGASTGANVSHAALDMAKSLVPLAARSGAARATLLGLLRAEGLNIPSFARLRQMVNQNGVGMNDLRKRVFGVTIAMSHLSDMAKNVANALSQQVSTQLANAALASTGFNTKLAKLQTDAANGAPWATIKGDLASVQTSINAAGLRGIAWGNQMAQGSSHASGSVRNAGAQMQTAFGNALTSAQRLQAFIDSMHGKNIVMTFSTSGSPGGGGGGGGGGGHFTGGGSGGAAIRLNVGVGGAGTVIHVHGSVLTEQQLSQFVQTGINRKTIRNGSTQLFRPGRLH